MKGIYLITSPSGKVYVGQSWNIHKRWAQYRNLDCKKQRHLYNSLKKHGADNHKFEIIAVLDKSLSQKYLDAFEIMVGKKYKDMGYTLMNIKELGRGGKHSAESKQRMRKKHTEETKRKISLKKTGKKRKPEEIQALLGRVQSEETRKKISKKLTGVKLSDERRANMAKSRTGKKHSAETLAKLRKPHKKKLTA